MMVLNYDSKKNDGWWMCKTNQVNDRWPGLLWVLMQPSCCFSSSDLISGCNKSTYYSLWWQYSGKETMVTCTGIHFLWNSSSTDDVTWFPGFSTWQHAPENIGAEFPNADNLWLWGRWFWRRWCLANQTYVGHLLSDRHAAVTTGSK